MNTLIIYGSQYGSTKRYAERLAELTGTEAVDYKEAKNLGGYDRIVYLGALCAGGVMGLKKTLGKMASCKELFVVTVGLADPNDTEYFSEIKKSLKAQIPVDLYNEEKIFHLRGAIDYTQLNMKHRLMLSMFHSMASKMPESERKADAKAMLETYNRQVDFVDFNSLEPIVNTLR